MSIIADEILSFFGISGGISGIVLLSEHGSKVYKVSLPTRYQFSRCFTEIEFLGAILDSSNREIVLKAVSVDCLEFPEILEGLACASWKGLTGRGDSLFPLVPFLPGENDKFLYRTNDGEFWTANLYIPDSISFDWLSGGWSVSDIEAAARALRAFHESSEVVLSQGESLKSKENCRPSPVYNALSSIRSRISGELNLPDYLRNYPAYDTLKHLLKETVEKEFARPLFDYSIRAVSPELCLPGKLDFSRKVVCHGDFHAGNLLFSTTNKSASLSSLPRIVDLDYALPDSPLYDLGYALIMFCIRRCTCVKEISCSNESFSAENADNRSSCWSGSLENNPMDSIWRNAFLESYIDAGTHSWQSSFLEHLSVELYAYERAAAWLILEWTFSALDHRERMYGKKEQQAKIACMSRSLIEFLAWA